jgi:hypothetical protein
MLDYIYQSRTVDEIGNRYGCLKVIAHSPTQGKGARWACRCDCGKLVIRQASYLRRSDNKECVCGTVEDYRKLVDAFTNVGNPPCDLGCSHQKKCSEERRACDVYKRWVSHGRHVEPDPETYPPTYSIYEKIFQGALNDA